MNFKYRLIILFAITSYYNYYLYSAQLWPSDNTIDAKSLIKQWFNYAANNNLEALQELSSIVGVNTQNIAGQTALMIAAALNAEQIVKFLLKIPGLNINLQDNQGHSALMLACINGHENIVKLLLAKTDIDINAQNDNGITALLYAVISKSEKIVTALINVAEININVKDNSGNIPLVWAAENGLENIVELLLKAPGIDVNLHYNGANALIMAISKGHINIIKRLINDSRIDVNRDNFQYHPLYIAVLTDDENIVKLILEVPGVNIIAKNGDGHTALMLAKDKNLNAIAKLIEDKIRELTTKAFKAVEHNDITTLKSIINQIGRDIIDIDGHTLIDKALADRKTEIVVFLLKTAENSKELISRFSVKATKLSVELLRTYATLAFNKDLPDDLRSIFIKILPNVTTLLERLSNTNSCMNCSKAHCDKKCGNCKQVYYCSDECQKAHWKTHKSLCKKV